MSSTTIKKWLITGASSGLGLEMALSALRAGHHVIGTSRNIEIAAASNPEFDRLGGRWLKLDVSQPEAQEVLEKLFSQEEEYQQSQHWVVVNNAGNSLLGAVEDMSEGQISAYLQINLFGPIRVWKAALPVLRRHKMGTLITISSIWGIVNKSEHMMYSAAKATIESLTESYADVLAPFGIRVMIIEPGGFRTKFPANASRSDGGTTEDYAERINAWGDIIDAAGKDETMVNGDPGRFGEKVLDAVEKQGDFKKIWMDQVKGKVLRVQLGSDCYEILGKRLRELQDGYEKMSEIAKSTDIC
ncbi:hypothetical protein N7495_001664 [Penicillium taxi]|uniref:uncharacterized protein n=1 Tax=Penicillium taxi TaxID=168475 RepID=UPI0025450D08|nr:uncharacterized protein N7495_001664 [Penicillium taxi]KAJ5908982.1 hypothetical protein N7495_001664 [Penicillium taxi]